MIFCTAYLLRRDGERLPPEQVRQTARQGWLWYGQKTPIGIPVPSARLFMPDEPYPLQLEFVREVAITNGGVLLQGQEYVSASDMRIIWQGWWCVPAAEPAGIVKPVAAASYSKVTRSASAHVTSVHSRPPL